MFTHVFWNILSEYISKKDLSLAAHHLVSELVDAGADEDDLWDMCKGNPILRGAGIEQLGEVADEIEEDDDI